MSNKSYKSLINKGSILLLGIATLFASVETKSIQAQETDTNTTIEEVAEEEASIGQEVTVRGEVEEVEPGISFIIEEEDIFEEDEVLVINISEQILPEETEDLRLQVTGTIGSLILADVEQEYGLDLDPELYVEYENQPVILAEYMVAAPELEEIAENPDRFYGQEIALEGEIEDIKNDYAFTLKEDALIEDDSLLVINATGQPLPEGEETVVMTGMVRPFVKAEFERDYDLTWDLDVQEEIEAEYSDKPVLVVDEIYPSATDDSVGLFD